MRHPVSAIFFLALAYLLSGRLGLAIPYVGSNITLIWLPTGLAVAALMRWGIGCWPGVMLGAVLTNLSIGSGLALSICIAVGNTLAPLLAVKILQVTRFHTDFDRQRDFFLFVLAALLGMLLSATGGVLSLQHFGVLPSELLGKAWLTWWLGDAVGVLLIAPFLLSLTHERTREMLKRRRELLGWSALLLLICGAVFFFNDGTDGRSFPLAFLPVPLLVWTTLRFGITGASLSVLVLSVIAALATATGHGPFKQPDPQQGLILLWSYVVTLSLVGMIINALQSERQAMLRQLSEKEALLRAIVETEPECVKLISPEGRMLQMNQAGLDMLEADSIDQLSGHTLSEMVLPEYREAFNKLTQEVFSGGSGILELEMHALKGTRRWVETHAVPMRDADGRITALLSITRDITKRKQAEAQVHMLAFFDPLTGLPNRRLLLDRIDHALASCRRTHAYAALIFIDLDHFKNLNDTQGHGVGDRLLMEVARRLELCVRECDTVARLGGDEFVLLLEGLAQEKVQAAIEAEHIAEKITDTLSRPYLLNELESYSTPSMGICLFSGQDDDVGELLKRADMAMYQAKNAGRNTIRFFDPAMQAHLAVRTALESDLRRAIGREQLVLHYQAQVDGGLSIVGAEALLRWRHPQRGWIAPSEFIPLAEESSLILPVGHWVLENACRQLHQWGGDSRTRELSLAVNVSARQFRQSDFVAQVNDAIQRSGCNPGALKLELTESMVLDNVEQAIDKMHALQRLGVSMSMDDFGTGYSSLSYLKRLPIDQLKIDQSFVHDISTDPDDEAIVKAIIGLAEVLGVSVIAEGVETEAQLAFLQRHGCPAFQGYLFGRPAPLAEFEAQLAVAA